jgi:hypothetical protein
MGFIRYKINVANALLAVIESEIGDVVSISDSYDQNVDDEEDNEDGA